MISTLQAQIIEAEQRLRQAQLHSDVAALDELISPDLIFTDHRGQVVGKADDLAMHRARVLKLTHSEALDEHITLHNGFAVISVLLHLIGSFDGTPIDQRIRYTRIWAQMPDGAIQLVAGHMSALPE